MFFSVALPIIFMLLKADCYITNDTDQIRLVKTIFANYDETLRPVIDTATVTNVTLNPALFSIVETDEAAESIVIVQWFRMIWSDAFIRWNPSDYGGMEQLLIPISRIWYPDITYLNMVDVKPNVPEEKNYAIIDYNGTVLISIDEVLTMHCKYHIVMFPFDIQNCTISIVSWMHTADQMDIFFTTPTDLSSYNQNAEWDLISLTARRSRKHYGAATTAWVNVYYDILIQRKPAYYLLTFVLPCFMITTISIIGIFAPFNDAGDREEKVTMGLTTLLTMAIILTIITDKMPKSSEGMPLLAIYIMLQIAIAAIVSLMAVIIMYQHRKWTSGEPISHWLLSITRLTHKQRNSSAKEAKIAAVSPQCYKFDDMANGPNSPSSITRQQSMFFKDIQAMVRQLVEYLYDKSEEENLRNEWQRATQRLDLLLMIMFLILNCIVTVGLIIIGYGNLEI